MTTILVLMHIHPNSITVLCQCPCPLAPLHSHILSTLLKFLVTVLPSVKGWRLSSRQKGYTSTWTEQAIHKRLQEVKVAVEGDVPIAMNNSSTCFSIVVDILQ